MDETKQPAVKEMTPDELAEFQAHLNGVSNVIRVEGGSLPQNVAHAERALAAELGVTPSVAFISAAACSFGLRDCPGLLSRMAFAEPQELFR